MFLKNIHKSVSIGEVIEHYTDRGPYPAALMLGLLGDRSLHVVMALESASVDFVHVITAYEPNEGHFHGDLRTRRSRSDG